MTRDEAKKLFPILEEFANGGIIECRVDIVDRWTICTNLPLDAVRFEYRIKPKPRELWVNIYDQKDGDERIFVHYSKESATAKGLPCKENPGCGLPSTIKVREVLDDE